MPQVNTEIWLEPENAYTGFNQRTGTSDINDPDFTDFPPISLCTYTDAASYKQLLYQWLNGGKLSLDDEIDKSICYVGMYNSELPQLNIVGLYNNTKNTLDDPLYKTDNTQIQSFFFTGITNYNEFADRLDWGPSQLYTDTYITYDYRLRRYKGGIIGSAPNVSPQGNANCNGFLNVFQNFGIKCFILEINVKYKTGTSNSDVTTSTYTLKEYIEQTTEWKAEHPIVSAYCRPFWRSNKNGTYSYIKPLGYFGELMPVFTLPYLSNAADITDNISYHTNVCRTTATRTGYFPIYGAIKQELTASASAQAVEEQGRAALLVGANRGTLNSITSGGSKSYWLELDGTNDDNIEFIRRGAAAYGMFFCDDIGTLADSGQDVLRWIDDKMCLGTINDNGLTNGDYTHGIQNATQRQFDWKTINDSDFDPSLPPTPQPDTGAVSPVGLDFTLAGQGTNIYILNPSEIQRAWKDIFGSDVSIKQFGNQPMNAILSLKWTPFDWTYGGAQNEKPIILGDQEANPCHVYKVVDTVAHAEKHGSGTIKFNFNKNFYNSRNIQARLFLPFYGYYELPTAQLLSSTLKIDFYYALPDELGVYIISYDDVIYDYCECSVDMDVPLTGSNAAAISASKRSEALTIATQVASMAATAVSAGVGAWAGFNVAAGLGAGALAGGTQILGAEGAAQWAGQLANTAKTLGFISQGAKATSGLVGGITGIANTIHNAKVDRAALKTNLPYHGSALQTTFLHMSMKPYVQIFKNNIMEGLGTSEGGTVKVELGGGTKTDYMLKVGHACDVWKNLNEMPSASLLQTTGMANMDTNGMTLAEVQELNSILQSGFFKSV